MLPYINVDFLGDLRSRILSPLGPNPLDVRNIFWMWTWAFSLLIGRFIDVSTLGLKASRFTTYLLENVLSQLTMAWLISTRLDLSGVIFANDYKVFYSEEKGKYGTCGRKKNQEIIFFCEEKGPGWSQLRFNNCTHDNCPSDNYTHEKRLSSS